MTEQPPLYYFHVVQYEIVYFQDILRTTELYTPSSLDQVEEKGIERDLVEGLMWNVRRYQFLFSFHLLCFFIKVSWGVICRLYSCGRCKCCCSNCEMKRFYI